MTDKTDALVARLRRRAKASAHNHSEWAIGVEFAADELEREALAEQPAPPCACFDHADAICPEHRPSQPAEGDGAVARAWAEGYASGVTDERTSEANIGIAGFGAKVEPARENPYTRPAATAVVPGGFVLVPEKMRVEPAAWDAAQFVFGGPGTGEDEEFLPCTLWIGEIDNEDGSPPVYGLHAFCDECPEGGSITLSEFSAVPAAPKGRVTIAEAAKLLTRWLDTEECECEPYGHSCGRPDVVRVRDDLLALATGEQP